MFVLRGLTLIALSSLTVCYPGASIYRNIRRLSGSPNIYARQEEEQPKNNDPEAWCETIDVMADEANALKVWEDRGVGYWMTYFLQNSIEPKDDGWPAQLYAKAVPNGVEHASNCGNIGAACSFNLTCTELTERGYGHAYWILDALSHFQSHLNAAHELLQNKVLSDYLAIDQLVRDFSTPSEYQVASGIKAYVSASLFIAGGAAGATSLSIGALAKTRPAQLGVARGNLNSATAKGDQKGIDDAKKMIAAIEKDIKRLEGGGVASSVTGALIYLAAPIFALSVNANVEEEGVVNAGDLSDQIYSMFDASLRNMEMIGKLATGQAYMGERDYSLLPGQVGQHGPYTAMDGDYIQEFFSDGKFLLGLTNTTLTGALEASFQTFRSKLVDSALQDGNFKLIAETNLETKEACDEKYGAVWIEPYCFRLFRRYINNGAKCQYYDGQAVDMGDPCEYAAADDSVYDNIEKYGLDFAEYVKDAFACARDGDGTVDLQDLPIDGTLPLCWFNIETKAANFQWKALGRNGKSQNVVEEEFA